jgi:hypothetical protein
VKDQIKQQIAWAINQWKGTMTVDELAQTIMEAPLVMDMLQATEAVKRAEFERGWAGGFKLGHRLGSEGKPANYPANLSE